MGDGYDVTHFSRQVMVTVAAQVFVRIRSSQHVMSAGKCSSTEYSSSQHREKARKMRLSQHVIELEVHT